MILFTKYDIKANTQLENVTSSLLQISTKINKNIDFTSFPLRCRNMESAFFGQYAFDLFFKLHIFSTHKRNYSCCHLYSLVEPVLVVSFDLDSGEKRWRGGGGGGTAFTQSL